MFSQKERRPEGFSLLQCQDEMPTQVVKDYKKRPWYNSYVCVETMNLLLESINARPLALQADKQAEIEGR